MEASATGNWFLEHPLAICRLDKLSRNDDPLPKKLADILWASSTTIRSQSVPSSLVSTPHNEKSEDFHLFLALLDGDRFEGKFRDGEHSADVSDLMRRMIKEQLFKFDGTRLFPERRAYAVGYKLSDLEAQFYKEVTDYVREEFNRADNLD